MWIPISAALIRGGTYLRLRACQRKYGIQYNAALATAGATRGTSRQKMYQELCL